MVIHPPSELDPSTEPDIEALLAACPADGETVVDMSEVTFCDSTGLRVIVAHWRRHEDAGGSLQVVGAAPHVRRVFQITGLQHLLD